MMTGTMLEVDGMEVLKPVLLFYNVQKPQENMKLWASVN